MNNFFFSYKKKWKQNKQIERRRRKTFQNIQINAKMKKERISSYSHAHTNMIEMRFENENMFFSHVYRMLLNNRTNTFIKSTSKSYTMIFNIIQFIQLQMKHFSFSGILFFRDKNLSRWLSTGFFFVQVFLLYNFFSISQTSQLVFHEIRDAECQSVQCTLYI